MAKIVTFGELMIRLQPFHYERFVQASNLAFTFGGGEANVAVSLANFGMDAAFVTKLPAHAIGQAAVNSLRRYGVDTSYIIRGGERVGIYFNEKGASQRPSVCIYDRAHSAIVLKGSIGSTLPVLHRRSVRMLPPFVNRLARRRKRETSKFRATLITAVNFGQESRQAKR